MQLQDSYIFAFSLLFSINERAAAQPPPVAVTSEAAAACVGLLTPTEIRETHSASIAWAYDRSSSTRTSSGSSNSIGGRLAGIISVNLGSNSARQEDKIQTDVMNWRGDEASSYIARFIPAEQSESYASCIKDVLGREDGSLGIQLDDVTNGTATFTLHIRSTNGISIDRRLSIWTNGNPRGTWDKTYSSSAHHPHISIDWPDQGKPLVLRAQLRQVGKGGGLIGSPAKYIVWPEIKEVPTLHVPKDEEARYPNNGPSGTYRSSPIIVRAEANEVLFFDEVKRPPGMDLHKTWGAKDIPCDEKGVQLNEDNDASLVSGYVYCKMHGWADENPGYLAHFEVRGVSVTQTAPDPKISMVERAF